MDSPSARWGLRPQAPMMFANFGDKSNLVIEKSWIRFSRKLTEPESIEEPFPYGNLSISLQ
ncbi:hypothetical protein J6590_096725 [Homalodisca vitripennis]|nr:hypothetical protein J6590_096725 [Homalodisca vitripennis]